MKKIKPEHYFYATDGQVVKSLEELPKVLEHMDSGAFCFHANEQRNDFANWVKHVFNKKALANKLIKAKTRPQAIDILEQSLIKKRKIKKIKKTQIKKTSKEQGYFSRLEQLILNKKLPENMLEEMKKHWE